MSLEKCWLPLLTAFVEFVPGARRRGTAFFGTLVNTLLKPSIRNRVASLGMSFAHRVGLRVGSSRILVDQQGREHLGVNAMPEIVGVIDAVAGQVVILFSQQNLVPHRSHVGQRDPRFAK